jgi:hypothetical protein
MGEYWLGGRNLSETHLFTPIGAEWLLTFILQLLLLGGMVLLLWRKRHDPKLRTVAIVFLGTLAAGQVMNAYSQPGDPQMQLNVMPWLSVAVALLLAELPASIARPAMAVAAILALVPLAYIIKAFGATRGADGQMQAALTKLEQLSDPAQTIYVYGGMEGIITWHYAMWRPDLGSWGWARSVCELGPSPQAVPKFKWIGLFAPLVLNPNWTTEKYVAHIKAELKCAFDNGYRVIAGPTRTHLDSQIDGMVTLLNLRKHGLALLPVLQNYRAWPIGGPAGDYPDGYVEITRP